MSRIGKRPIALPSGVKITLSDSLIEVQGPKGVLSRRVMDGVSLEITSDTILVQRESDSLNARSAHGLTRTLISNMVTGVTTGFEKSLEISGVGYRAEAKGRF